MTSRVLAVACVGLSFGSSAFAQDFNVSGACPGVVNLELTNGTPNGNHVFVTGTLGGSTVMMGGPCVGDTLDLGAPLKVRFNGAADGAGAKTLSPNVGAGACATGGQWLDLTTCTTTEALSLTPACAVTDDSYGDIPPGAANMADPAFYALWSEAIVGGGLRQDFTVDDPAAPFTVPAGVAIDYFDAAQLYMCTSFYNLSEATVHDGVPAAYSAVTLDVNGNVTMNSVAPLDAIKVVVTGGETTCGPLNPAGPLGTALGTDDIRVFGHTTWELAYNIPSPDMDAWMSNAVGGAMAYATDWEPFIAGESYFGLESNYVFTYDTDGCDTVLLDALGYLIQEPAPVGPLDNLAESDFFGHAWIFTL